jgi:hypothetical protein
VRRRGFLGVLLSLPVIGTAAGRALGDAPAASAAATCAHAVVEASESMAATLWGYMDHASTWDEAVADLRRYVADGHADAAMFADIADAIERELARTDGENLQGVLGFYPGAVLMLHGLRSVRDYGTTEIFDAQATFVRRLMVVV